MTIQTSIGYATVNDIFVRGRNLSSDIIPNADFVDMVSLCILGRTPEPNFKRMLNLLLVTSTDHGFTPSSISSRLTYLGAPESLQGAVAAGLLGAGDRYLGATQNVAQMLVTESRGLAPDAEQSEYDERASDHASPLLRRPERPAANECNTTAASAVKHATSPLR